MKKGLPRKLHLVLLLCIGPSQILFSQDEINRHIASVVYLDSVVVTATRGEFSVSDFIEFVRNDSTFYSAFKKLRQTPYLFSTQMVFFDRRKNERARYSASRRQKIDGKCRYQIMINESQSGNLYKKKNRSMNYYTFSLYDRLFITHDTVCGIFDSDDKSTSQKKGMEGHVEELKKLIFAPGSKSNVPFIGSKTEIFSKKMVGRYDFFIRSEKYRETKDAYVFEARLKPRYASLQNNKTVIKELTTYFSKENFQVLGRSYRLAHFKALYQFDISMEVELTEHTDFYIPQKIVYDGFWNVPTKKKETSNFTIDFYHE